MWFQNRRAKHKRMEQVQASLQTFSNETMDGSDTNEMCQSYDERLDEAKISVGASFTRYFALSKNVRHTITNPSRGVPVLVYNPRKGSDAIVSR